MNENTIWDYLKKKVLTVTGIENVEPKDCKLIAEAIKRDTSKTVSETTLKRVYGFAAAHFEASLHTKNILSQYCGHLNWEEYVRAVSADASNLRKTTGTWQKMRADVNKVNNFMTTAVKNKAVIPFSKMINRNSIHAHFDEFASSSALATVVSAPTGYGKTIAVCQWLQDKESIQNGNDLALYLNSSFLLSSLKTGINLNYWMMKMIGLAPSHHLEKPIVDDSSLDGKFYFIIDGFDELMFRKNQFEILVHLLTDILSIYKASNWFKIAVIMRDSTWLDWKSQLMSDNKLWFLGKMNDEGQNLGLLSPKELNTLIQMERPFSNKELLDENFETLRHPLFHQLYYKKYNEVIKYDQFNELLVFELVTDYMVQNIVHGNQALNKMDLIFYLLDLAEYTAGIYHIDKSRIQLRRHGFLNTYSNLIQLGFIRETEKLSMLNKQIYVQFGNLHCLGSCIAAFLLKKDAGFTPVKLGYIEQRWGMNKTLKQIIMKWCIFQSSYLGKEMEWLQGFQEYLNIEEQKALSGFISLLKGRQGIVL